MEGDTVTIHYICRDEEGAVVDDSSRAEEPVSFEVGAGEVTGNPLFQVRMPVLKPQLACMHACMHADQRCPVLRASPLCPKMLQGLPSRVQGSAQAEGAEQEER